MEPFFCFQEEEAGNFPSSDHQSVAIWTKLGLAECSRATTPKWLSGKVLAEHCWREAGVYFSRFKRRCIKKGGPPAIHDTTLVAAATLVWQNFNGEGEPSNIVFVHVWLGGRVAHPREMVGLLPLLVRGTRCPPTMLVVEGLH
jgi:hypothetical protein